MNETNRGDNMRLIRLKEVMKISGLSRSGIYKFIKEGKFPKSVSLGVRSVAWVEQEVQDWVEQIIFNRDENN